MKRLTTARWAWLACWGGVICGGCAVEYQVSIAALRDAAALSTEQQARAVIPAYALEENAKLTYVRYS